MATGTSVQQSQIVFENTGTTLVQIAATADTLTLSGNSNQVAVLGGRDVNVPSSFVTRQYVDSLATGIQWLPSSVAATTGPGDLNTDYAAGQTVDGVTLVAGDIILIKDQGAINGVQNGVYTVQTTGAPIRIPELDTGADASSNATAVTGGIVNDGTLWICANASGDATVGTDALTWVLFGTTSTLIPGAALGKTGNTLNVLVDDSTIEIVADALRVKTVPNANLANSSITLTAGTAIGGGGSVSLGSSTTINVLYDDTTIGLNGGNALEVKNGGLTNAKLANDSVTITTGAASALSGGGAVALGSSLGLSVNVDGSSIGISSNALGVLAGGITNGMLANSSVTLASGSGVTVTGSPLSLGGTATVAVDATVVRTTGAQSVGGTKTFTSQTLVTDTTASTSSSTGALVVTGGLGVGGDTFVAGDVTCNVLHSVSDLNAKTNIRQIDGRRASVIMNEIRPVFYKLKKTGVESAGVIAQELAHCLPEAVNRNKTTGQYSVDYRILWTVLARAHQELVQRYSEMSIRLEKLSAKIQAPAEEEEKSTAS